jgi:hypothetical protein
MAEPADKPADQPAEEAPPAAPATDKKKGVVKWFNATKVRGLEALRTGRTAPPSLDLSKPGVQAAIGVLGCVLRPLNLSYALPGRLAGLRVHHPRGGRVRGAQGGSFCSPGALGAMAGAMSAEISPRWRGLDRRVDRAPSPKGCSWPSARRGRSCVLKAIAPSHGRGSLPISDEHPGRGLPQPARGRGGGV